MATLTFNKVDDFYEAETTVNNDFNLHLEIVKPTEVTIDVKTAGSKFANAFYERHASEVFDRDFDDIVYPKMIRVRSWAAVTNGIITEKEG